MYDHSFLFIVISDNRQAEEALKKMKPLEDCSYTFCTVSCMKDAAAYSAKKDAAFIYDHAGKTDMIQNAEKYKELILVAGDRDSQLTDPSVIAAVSEVWIMPEQNRYDAGLLEIYFSRLAERMKQRADARKQQVCFDTIINSVPDIAWFKDTKGAHLIVNDSFCETVGKKKDKIYKKGHCYIWNATKEDEAVCLTSDRLIMDAKGTQTFEEDIKTGKSFRRLVSYKSALVDVDGEIFGTCGIAHDITEQQNMRTELDLVLDSVPFAVLVENTEDIVLNTNTRFNKYFPAYKDIVGKSSKEWKQSLKKRLLMDDRIMEVVLQSGNEEKVLVYEEEPIYDIFKNATGKIVTLMDVTLEWSIAQQNEHTANTDYLTGLSNRRNLMHYLEEVYKQDDITLVMLDLDNFKYVNDTFGHKAGDQALIKTAELLQKKFEDDFVSRLGGDEFLVVIKGKSTEDVRREAMILLDAMHSEFGQQKEFCGVTVSAGVVSTSSFPKPQRSITDLLKIVDDLLYKAKKNGKNCCCAYGED